MLFALYSQKLLEIKLSNHSENWLSMWMTLPKEVVLFSPSSSSHRFLTLIRFVKETLQSFDPQTRYSCIPVILFSITLHSEQSNVKKCASLSNIVEWELLIWRMFSWVNKYLGMQIYFSSHYSIHCRKLHLICGRSSREPSPLSFLLFYQIENQ